MSGKLICLTVAFSVVSLTSATSAEVIQISDTQNWNTFADGGFGSGDTLQILSGGSLTLSGKSRLVNNMELIVEEGGSFTINTRMDMDTGAVITMNGGQANINGDFKFPDNDLGDVYIYLNGGLLVVDNTESFASRGGVLYVGGGRMRTGHVSVLRRDPEGDEWNIQLLPSYDELHIDDLGGDVKEIWASAELAVQFDLAASGDLEAVSPVVITVALSKARQETVTVDYAVTGGTAVNGEDYSLTGGTLDFSPGQTSRSISIIIFDDGSDEQDETIEITLSNVQGGQMQLGANTQHVYTIIDPRPGVAFDSPESEGREDVSPAYIPVSLSSPSTAPVMVDYSVTGGTAIGGGVDYNLPPGTLQFEPGEVTRYIIVTILQDDLDEYPNETVEITLSYPVNTKLGEVRQHTFTILPPTVRLCPIGDLNGDCKVDFDDLRIFVDQWLAPAGSCAGDGCADLDGVNGVGALDFSLLTGDWLEKAWPIVINEFLASNSSGYGDGYDWIELYNATPVTIELGGMYLTDTLNDPTKYRIPDGIRIDRYGYRIFWADGDPNEGDFYTNFRLDAGGEQIGLFNTDGTTLIDSIDFGPQDTDLSYGRYPDAGGNWRVFAIPTPDAENDGTYAGIVALPVFSHEHGFYETSFELSIACDTSGATIHYTTNGSDPTEANGTVYTGPITIDQTAFVRAMAFKSGWLPTKSYTQTYIFLENVLTQTKSTGFNDEIDWDMDTDVVNDPRYSGDVMKNALTAIPTLSVVMEYEHVFGSSDGIFLNGHQCGGNRAYEHPASLELIYPGVGPGFQINCAAQPHGAIRRGKKHSMDIQFKGMYGPAKLRYAFFESAPLHADSATDVFNRFVLRAGLGQSWATSGSDKVSYARDQWSRDTQIDMSDISSHGAFFHVYLNGLYFGLYNAAEEANHDFTSAYLGGDEDDWFAVKASIERNCPGYIINGDRARLDEMVARAETKDLEDPVKYEEFTTFLDIDRYIDYLMIIWYNGCGDMYDNNWFGGHRMNPPGPFMWFIWDTEASWLPSGGGWPPGSPTGRAWFPTNFIESWQNDHPGDVAVNNRIVKMWNALRENDDFKMRFADRIYKHCFNNGPLTDDNSIERWYIINDYIRDAVIAESARWGDSMSSTPRTRDDHWEPAVEYVANLMQGNVDIFITDLRSYGYYPSIDPPDFSQHGGDVPSPYSLTMSASGTIYYTLDGSDPRQPGGAVSAGALTYSAPITLNKSCIVKARAKSGEWSALHEATFSVGHIKENLRINEIMYHPSDPTPPEVAEGFTNDGVFEFLELQNISGTNSINLALVKFTNGIDFTFGSSPLGPGEYVVLVKDQAAFEFRYGPGINVAGTYTGSLNNGGERIELEDANGATILDFRYEDGWYDITDGGGFSLTIKDPASTEPNNWDDKSSWRPSAAFGGSPGADDGSQVPELGSVKINEILAHSHSMEPDWIELHNTTGDVINIGGWFLSDSGSDLTRYEIPMDAPEASIPAGGYVVFYENQHFGNDTAPGCHTPFALSENGETVYLHSGQGGVLTGYSEEEEFGASESNVAFGRYEKSTGTYNFVAMSENTPDGLNADPKVGPIVINEIMYNPPAGGSYDHDEYEYIELYNISGELVNLYRVYPDEGGIQVSWQFTDGIDYVFPADTTIDPGEYIVVAKNLAAFAERYPDVPLGIVYGPFLDGTNLKNGGEKVDFSMPGDVDGVGERQYIRIDRVNYDDVDPWPTAPDGGGESLSRIVPANYGNDVANWQAATTSAGDTNP